MSDDGAGDDDEISLTQGEETPHLVARTCPYCLSPFFRSSRAVICRVCGTPHHADCWQENGGCTTYGCTQAPGHRITRAAPVPAEETRLVGPSIPLPGRMQWLPAVLGRRPEDIELVADAAGVLSMIGGIGSAHYLLSPLLVLCVLGIVQGLRALSMLRSSGMASSDSEYGPLGSSDVRYRAKIAVIAGIFFIAVAVANYWAELAS